MKPIPIRYQLEKDIESVNESSALWLKERFIEVLESDKDFTRKSAKELALEVGAELFGEYGINKLEGAGISSITVYQPLHTPKLTITVNNEQALMKAGFVKEVVDVASIKEAYESGQYKKLIEEHCEVTYDVKEDPKRLKINKRRSSNNSASLTTGEEKAS